MAVAMCNAQRTPNPRQHVWQGLKQKGGDVKVVKWLKEMFPNMKEDEVNLLATISTKQELKQYAEDLGLDKKDVQFCLCLKPTVVQVLQEKRPAVCVKRNVDIRKMRNVCR